MNSSYSSDRKLLLPCIAFFLPWIISPLSSLLLHVDQNTHFTLFQGAKWVHLEQKRCFVLPSRTKGKVTFPSIHTKIAAVVMTANGVIITIFRTNCWC